MNDEMICMNELEYILKRFVFRGVVPIALLICTLIMSRDWLARNPDFGLYNTQKLLDFVGIGLMPLVFASVYFAIRYIGINIMAGSPVMLAIGIIFFCISWSMGLIMTIWRIITAVYYFPAGIVQLVRYAQGKRRVIVE